MDYKLDDIKILNEENVVKSIGSKNKKLELRLLTIHEYYDIFIPRFVVLIELMKRQIGVFDLPDGNMWKIKKKMNTAIKYIKRALSFDMVRKEFIELLNAVGFMKMKKKYFESNVKITELPMIFFHIYKFNIDGVKKKLSEIELALTKFKQQPLTSTEKSLTEGGLKAKLPRRHQLSKE